MRKIFKSFIFIFLCTLIFLSVNPAQAHAEEYFTVKSSVNSKYQITLKWKKQSCSQIRIYREQVTPTGNKKPVLIKTLKGTATTFTDKKAKKKIAYYYHVKAYKKVNNKLVLKSIGDGYDYCGLIKPAYDDYFHAWGPYTTSSIKLTFGSGIGMTPNGFQIQRKANNGTYKTVKTFKTTKRSLSWNNTGLKTGVKYTYRIRSYKKIGKKTIYSNWSEPYTRITALRFGNYSVSSLSFPSSRYGDFSISIKSTSILNAVVDFRESLFVGYQDMDVEQDPIITKITVDGVTVDSNNTKVKPNSTITFYFQYPDLYDKVDPNNIPYLRLQFEAVYNGTPIILEYQEVTKQLSVTMNDEEIF